MNQTIISKLFAIPVTLASLLLAYCAASPEERRDYEVLPVEIVADPMPVAPTKADLTTTTAPTTTQAPQLTEEERIALARHQYGKCGEWHDLAISVGWPEAEWPTLSYVMYRESRCNIGSHNKTDPSSGSRGLLQINGFWCRKSQWSQAGWLQDRGILNVCDDLFVGETNLRAGLAIWLYGEEKHGCGWRGPWATRCDKYLVAEPHPGY